MSQDVEACFCSINHAGKSDTAPALVRQLRPVAREIAPSTSVNFLPPRPLGVYGHTTTAMHGGGTPPPPPPPHICGKVRDSHESAVFLPFGWCSIVLTPFRPHPSSGGQLTYVGLD